MPIPSKVLLFGGTFDPPHIAHTTLARAAAAHLECDRILFIPNRINPLKTDSPPTPAAHRLAMTNLAVASIDGGEVSTIELDREGPSFFVETLEALREQYADAELIFLLGADSAASFNAWKDWRRILELATPAVLMRPPLDRAAFAQQLASWCEPAQVDWWLARIVPVDVMDVSATDVRERLEGGDSTADLLHPDVAAYIVRHNLYQPAE